MGKKRGILIVIILFILFGVLAISSAIETELSKPIKEYTQSSETIILKNRTNDATISEMQLKTPRDFNVIDRGEDIFQEVAEIDFLNVKRDYSNWNEDMDFINLKSGRTQIREYQLKYKIQTGTHKVSHSNEVCSNELVEKNETKNPVFEEVCRNIPYTTLEPTYDWVEFTELSELPLGEVTIGIFVDIQKGEKIEWIPTWFDIKITEWAVWTESLGTGLLEFWTANNSKTDGNHIAGVFNTINLSNHTNGQPSPGSIATGGLFGNALSVGSSSSIPAWNATRNLSAGGAGGGDDLINWTDKWTLSFWIKTTDQSTLANIVGISESLNSITASSPFYNQSASPTWNNIILTHYGNKTFSIYGNGTRILDVVFPSWCGDWGLRLHSIGSDGKLSLGLGDGCADYDGTFKFGYLQSQGNNDVNDVSVLADIDEIGLWNRSLTSQEISDLYNGGNGITYSNVTDYPVVTINFPKNRTYGFGDKTLNLNVSINENGTIIYSWNNGANNLTMTANNSRTGFTAVNNTALDGGHTINFYANDTFGNKNYSEQVNFSLDTQYPNVSINNITTTDGSQTISFNSSTEDENIKNCFYSIYNSDGGVDGLNNNVTFTCNQTNQEIVSGVTVTAYATFDLCTYGNDSGGNINQSCQQFTTNTSTPPASTGGTSSSGGFSTTQLIPVIGLIQPETIRTFSDLEREIIYARINTYCSNKAQQTLAVSDFSEECILKRTDLTELVEILSKDLTISEEELNVFFTQYKQKQRFPGLETLENIRKYELFSSSLGFSNFLNILPKQISALRLLIQPFGNFTFESSVISNKPLRSCNVLLNQGNKLDCFVANSTINIKYSIESTNFFNKIFTGQVEIITLVEDENNIEVRQIPINFRAVNFGYLVGGVPIWIILLVVIIIATVLTFYIIGKRKREKLLNSIKFSFKRNK